MTPTMAFAVGGDDPEPTEYAAQIGDTNYSTFEGAFAAIPENGADTTVKLLKDVDLGSAALTIDKGSTKVTFDLNGKTISGNYSSTSNGMFTILGSNLTLTDTSGGEVKGSIINTDPLNKGSATIYLNVKYPNATTDCFLKVDGGVTIENKSTSTSSSVVYEHNNASTVYKPYVEINDASLEGNGYITKQTISSGAYAGSIILNGGNYKSTKSYSLNYSSGTNASFIINGGTFDVSYWNSSLNAFVPSSKHISLDATSEGTAIDTVEVKNTAPDTYIAKIQGQNYYLVDGDISLLQTQFGVLPAGTTVDILADATYNPASFGTTIGGAEYKLTFDLAEDVKLDGLAKLKVAQVQVSGTNTGTFTCEAFDGTYEMNETGENGLFTCDITEASKIARVDRADGTSNYYSDILTAFSAAKASPKSTLKLLADTTYSSYINGPTMDFTLDLNGKSYTYTGNSDAFQLTADQSLKVIDSSELGGGTINATTANLAIGVKESLEGENAKVIIGENVTVNGPVFVAGKNSTLDVYGKINGGADAGIYNNGTWGNGPTTINIWPGAEVQSDVLGIYHPGKGQLNVHGGVITGGTGIEIRAGELNVFNGFILGTANEFSVDADGNPSGSTVTGAGIAVSQHTTDLPLSVNIFGGTIAGLYGLYENDLENTSHENVEINIHEGIFYGNSATLSENEPIYGNSFATEDLLGEHAKISSFTIAPNKVCIIATAHETEKISTVKATQQAAGTREHWRCIECGTLYTDPNGQDKDITTLTALAIPKIGSINLSATAYVYNGYVKTPAVTVKDTKGNTIAASNYTLTYSQGRKNVGTYSVKVTFKGDFYSGTATKTFKISPVKTSISKLTPRSKKIVVKWKKKTAQVSGYQIYCSTSSKFSNSKKITVSKATQVSKTISKLKGKKTYYVKIRTYKKVGSTKYYSAWSAAKKTKTKR
ncbi:fibronectin type III domain-containing protein [Candidatus Micrarchaeota archaeon]|nr:fibronectin type III domain-containing protein [Candidatus Micrarchaeota archaeon]